METEQIRNIERVVGAHTYLFRFAPSQIERLAECVVRLADDEHFNFDSIDATVVMGRARIAATPKPRNRIADRGDCWPLLED